MLQKNLEFEMEDEIIADEENTEGISEEMKEELLNNEQDYLQGLLEAADFVEEETKTLQIVRHGKTLFSFRIRPLTDEETHDIRKKYTKYERNKRTGMKMATGMDQTKFRSSLIYNSTIEEDKERLWNNKEAQNALKRKGKHIINALDVIDSVLLPGEKDMILNEIDEISGYEKEEALVETAKNL